MLPDCNNAIISASLPGLPAVTSIPKKYTLSLLGNRNQLSFLSVGVDPPKKLLQFTRYTPGVFMVISYEILPPPKGLPKLFVPPVIPTSFAVVVNDQSPVRVPDSASIITSPFSSLKEDSSSQIPSRTVPEIRPVVGSIVNVGGKFVAEYERLLSLAALT